MTTEIKALVDGFESRIEKLSSLGRVEKICDHAYTFHPEQQISSDWLIQRNKTVGLCLSAIIHGNEIGGIYALNDLLDHIALGVTPIHYPVSFFLGNVAAAYENKRFLEKDLNRCFASHDESYIEQRRAKELSPLLESSLFYLDIHQTMGANVHPFFIFPYTTENRLFASHLWADLPIVTHGQGNSFSVEGRCSDEFAITKGSIAITIETGQNGKDFYQHASAVMMGSLAVQKISRWLQNPSEFLKEPLTSPPTLFDCHQLTQPDDTHWVELAPGLKNFASIEKGEVIGSLQGAPYSSPTSGQIIFPKYRKSAPSPKNQELFWILEPATEDSFKES